MSVQIKMEDRRYWPGHVLAQFDKFVEYKLPVPVDPMVDIYRTAFSDQEWIAMRYLRQKKPLAVRSDESFALFWTDDKSGYGNCPHVEFKFPTNVQLPNFGVSLSSLPGPIERKLRVWITSVNHFRSLRKELSARLNGMLGNAGIGYRNRADLDYCVNTPGQIIRLWPQMQPFFYQSWKEDTKVAAMKSRLPEYLGYQITLEGGDEVWTTPDMFRCRNWQCTQTAKDRWNQINQVLELLALATDLKPVSGYPTFHGKID